jgi:ferredoxin
MARVIIKRTDGGLQVACDSCPVGCIKNVGNEFVIDQDSCIDCGVCQSLVDEGVIVEDSDASEQDILYNKEKAQ